MTPTERRLTNSLTETRLDTRWRPRRVLAKPRHRTTPDACTLHTATLWAISSRLSFSIHSGNMDGDEEMRVDDNERINWPTSGKGKGKATAHDEPYDLENLPWCVAERSPYVRSP